MPHDETYIGDAVYVSLDDRDQLRLRTGDGNNQVIYLNHDVMRALVRYAKNHGNFRFDPVAP